MKMSINPFCAIAVEEALKLKEQKVVSEVTVVTIGEQKAEDVLRTALAMGADKAMLIHTDKEIDKEV